MARHSYGLNMREVDVFRAVMRYRTVTAAAAALGSSQPTITRELLRLEEHIGFALFERKRQRLFPTARAVKLWDEVEAAFAGLGRINAAVERLQAATADTLTILSLPALAQSLLPQAVEQIVKRFPRLNIDISTQDPRNDSVLSGFNFDLGLSESFHSGHTARNAEITMLGVFDLVAVMTRDHPLASLRVCGPQDFAGLDYVSFPINDPYRAGLDQVFDEAGITRNVCVTAQSAASLCEMVLRRLGVAVINPLTALTHASRGLVMRPFVPAQKFIVSAVTPLDRPASEAAAALIPLLRSACTEAHGRIAAAFRD